MVAYDGCCCTQINEIFGTMFSKYDGDRAVLYTSIHDMTDAAAAASVLSPAEAAFLERSGGVVRGLRAAREAARGAWVAAGRTLEEIRQGALPVVTQWNLPLQRRRMEEARTVLQQQKADYAARGGSRNPELPTLAYLEERYALYMSDVARADAATAPWEAKLRAAKRAYDAAGTKMVSAEWAYEVDRAALEVDTGAIVRCRKELARDPTAISVVFDNADFLAFAHLMRGPACSALRRLTIGVRYIHTIESSAAEARAVSLWGRAKHDPQTCGPVAVLSSLAHCTALRELEIGGTCAYRCLRSARMLLLATCNMFCSSGL